MTKPVEVPVRPYHLSWDITSACPLKCGFCYSAAGKAGPGESTELVDLVVKNIAALRPMHLGIGGGDPLLSPHLMYSLESLVDRMERDLPATAIDTMILARRPDIAKAVRRINESFGAEKVSFYLSIHGLHDTHDKIVGIPGHFQEQLAAARILKEEGVSYGIGMVPLKDNISEIDRVLLLAMNLGASLFNVSQFVPTGRGREERKRNLSPADYHSLLEWVISTNRYFGRRYVVTHEHWLALVDPELRGSDLFIGCSAGIYYFGVRSNGDIVPCQLSSFVLGNVRQTDLVTAWQCDPVLDLWRRRAVTGRCASCGMLHKCGGCRCNAVSYGFGFLGEDPLCPFSDEEIRLVTTAPQPEALIEPRAGEQQLQPGWLVARKPLPATEQGLSLIVRCDERNTYVKLDGTARALYQSMPEQRPVTVAELVGSHGRSRSEALKDLQRMMTEGVVECRQCDTRSPLNT